jgi:hypothetical protein
MYRVTGSHNFLVICASLSILSDVVRLPCHRQQPARWILLSHVWLASGPASLRGRSWVSMPPECSTLTVVIKVSNPEDYTTVRQNHILLPGRRIIL